MINFSFGGEGEELSSCDWCAIADKPEEEAEGGMGGGGVSTK